MEDAEQVEKLDPGLLGQTKPRDRSLQALLFREEEEEKDTT